MATSQRTLSLQTRARRRGRLILALAALGLVGAVLSGCVRYASSRDHLEQDMLVLSPIDD